MIKPAATKYLNFKINYKYSNSKETGWISVFDELFTPVYSTLVMKPNNTNADEFNLWRGFIARPVEVVDMTKIQDILDLLLNSWCSGNTVYYEFLLNWFQCLIQFPETPNGTTPVITGEQGTGKNTITEFLNEFVLGEYITTELNGIKGLLNHFNKMLEGQKLILVNELHSESFINDMTEIKTKLMEKRIVITRKGIDSYMVDNIASYLMFSNHDFPIIIETGDRRYFPLKSSNYYKGNSEFFDKLRKTCFNQESGNHFLTFLMNRPKLASISSIRDKSIPMTEEKKEMIIMTAPAYERFFMYIKDQITDSLREGPLHLTATEFYKEFTQWLITGGERSTITLTKFGAYAVSKFTRYKHSKTRLTMYGLNMLNEKQELDRILALTTNPTQPNNTQNIQTETPLPPV
jgi:hypothetical protein